LDLKLPEQTMLCTLSVAAVTPAGHTIASNFIQHFVSGEPVPEREDRSTSLILRRRVQDWDAAEWSGGFSSREEAKAAGSCHGEGFGYFEWVFSDEALAHLADARRVSILLEASANRGNTAQTDSYRFPSQFELTIFGLPILRNLLPNHPHDTRGALSYLRGGHGAYGYLLQPTIENGLLDAVAAQTAATGTLRVRTAITQEPHGGLTIYDYDCGRYPVAPTVIIEWKGPRT
jgi:hypothetical protein